MSQQNQETPAQSVAEAIGCGIIMAGVAAFFLIVLTSNVEWAKKTGNEWLERSKTPAGYMTGKVTNVKTWQEEDFKHKEGNMTLTLPIRDRCEITFSDGRTRKFVGMPKDTVPTDKEITIIWGGFDILLEVVDAEEFKKRPNKPGDPPPPPKNVGAVVPEPEKKP